MPVVDKSIGRYAEIRQNKVSPHQVRVAVDCDFNNGAQDPLTTQLAAQGIVTVVDANRDEGGASHAVTDASTNTSSMLNLDIGPTLGDNVRVASAGTMASSRRPELDVFFRDTSAASTGSRIEIGFGASLADSNTMVEGCAIFRETGRGNDNWRIGAWCVAANVINLDWLGGAGAELTDVTGVAQSATLDDCLFGKGAGVLAEVNDGLIILNDRKPKAIVMTVGLAHSHGHEYTWEVWNGTTWLEFVGVGAAAAFGNTGRQFTEIPPAAVDAMERIGATDVLGRLDDEADMPGVTTALGRYGVRVRTTNLVGGGAARSANLTNIGVQEITEFGPDSSAYALNTDYRIEMRIGNHNPPSVEGRINGGAWVAAPLGSLTNSFAPLLDARITVQSHEAAVKSFAVDYIKAWSFRPGVAIPDLV
jgi:hypothetical protein